MDAKGAVMAGLLSRRRMLKVSAGALLAAGLWPGRLRAAETATRPLTFAVVNDLHFSDKGCVAFFEGMIRKLHEVEGLAFVLIAGDLTDNGTAEQCGTLHELLKTLRCPYYVTPGNHDALTPTDRGPFHTMFTDKLNFTFEAEGWQFVGLDTSDGQKVEKFDVRPPTLEFAGALAGKLDRSKPTFLFTHFPLGPEVKYRLQNAETLLEGLKPLNLQAIFNGHYHAFTEKKVLANTITTTNKCCSRKRGNHDKSVEKGFFVIRAAAGTYTRTFVEYGTPAATAPATRAATAPA